MSERKPRGKGHVPEESLPRYRHRAELAFLMQRMGGMVSGLGEYEDANKLWAMASKYRAMANELRVDLPADGDGDTSPQP
jgi:hypothetical protein